METSGDETKRECPRCMGDGYRESAVVEDKHGRLVVGERECFLCAGVGIVTETNYAIYKLMLRRVRDGW